MFALRTLFRPTPAYAGVTRGNAGVTKERQDDKGMCFPLPPHGKNNKKAIKKTAVRRSFINVNKIQQPILGTFVQDMVRLQMQVHEQMSL